MSGGGGSSEVEETRYERELADISIDRWNDYQQRFVPLENRLFGEVRTTDAEMEQAQGWANSASEQQFAGAREDLAGGLFSAGFNPSSGGFAARMGGLNTDEALATGMNQADIGQAMSDQETYGLQGITQLGRGNSTTAFQQYGQAAGSAQNQAISDARNALNERLANQQTIGTVAGAATAYGLGGGGPSQGTQGSGLQSNLFQQTGGSSAWDTSAIGGSSGGGGLQTLNQYAAGGYR